MEQKTRITVICVAVIGIIVFIAAMLGTSLRKLSTEEGKYLYTVLQSNAWKMISLRRNLKLGMKNLGNSSVYCTLQNIDFYSTAISSHFGFV